MGQEGEEKSNLFYPLMFILLSLIQMCLSQFRGIIVSSFTLLQSKRLHQHMIQCLLRSKITFFDSNPVGRILNRLSKDVGAMDLVLPYLTDTFLYISMKVVVVFVLVCILLPYMLIGLGIIITFLLLIRLKAVQVTNAAMQLDLMSRAPLSTQLAASLTGLQTIRAYGQQKYFLKKFFQNTEANASAYYTFLSLSRSLGFYLDFFSSLFSIIAVFICFALRNENNSLTFALAIQLLTDTLNNFQYGTRLSSELQNYTNSFSRCLEYTRLQSEAALTLSTDQNFNVIEGKIEFINATMRYRQDLPPALYDLSFLIPAKAKVAIVGRTGAGKSSILQVLLRMRELSSGSILIDNQDISKLGLHPLRQSVSLLPQTPFLINGTVTQNLNLFQESHHDEEEIWKVLELVHLAQHVHSLPNELNCVDANTLFSAGQKQLLSLARAILQNNKILVFDEPTANVDMATDRLIQKLIRSKFKDRTVLTIAHRLDTVIDSDLVIMMEKGMCVELGAPFTLLVKSEEDTEITAQTLFAETVKSAKGETEILFSKARNHYFQTLKQN